MTKQHDEKIIEFINRFVVTSVVVVSATFIGYWSLIGLQEVFLMSSPLLLTASYVICSGLSITLTAFYFKSGVTHEARH